MSDRLKNILIGAFVLSATLIAVWMILFLEPKIGDGKKVFLVHFSNVSGLSEGTRVTFAGKPVGEVTKIQEIPEARQGKADNQGRLYYYQVTLKIDSSVDIYDTDEITVQTAGLMGEKMIAIIPRHPPKGVTPELIHNYQVLYADSTDVLQMAMQQFTSVAKRIDQAVAAFNQWFARNEIYLSQSAQGLSQSLDQFQTLLASINQQEVVLAAKKTLDILYQDLSLVADVLEEIEQKGTIGSLDLAIQNFQEALQIFNLEGKNILQNVSEITQDIASGSGTLGKMVKSEDLYLWVTAIFSKVNTLMNDLNHYGLLFQYDKHWQRMRTKRANLLEALDTPKEFRSYFETEMNTLTTSLSRLYMLLEKAETPEERQSIFASPAFKKDFGSLLRQVNSFSDSLKLFTEEMMNSSQEACQP